MSPLKEESKTSSSDEVTSLLDDDDSVVETDDEQDDGEEESSVAARDGEGIDHDQSCGHDTNQTHSDDQRQQQQSSAIKMMVNTRDAASRRNSAATTPTLKNPPPAPRVVSSSSADQLAFDMNQPWERSLARQLEQVACDEQEYHYRPDFMFVGHTESTDFGEPVDHDDAASLGTSVSSTIPTKNQLIHRSLLMRGLKPEQDSTMDASLNNKAKPFVRRDSVGSQLTIASEDERDDSTNSAIPSHLLALIEEQRRKPASPKAASPYLELEPSTVDDESIQYFDYNDSTSALPDPACFCLGYNVFDYVLPPQEMTTRGTNWRKSVPRRNSQLFRVDEYPEENQTSPMTSSTANVSNADPEGTYYPFSADDPEV